MNSVTQAIWRFLYRLASPKAFYEFSKPWQRRLAYLSGTCFAYGLIGGVLLAPADYQQGDAFRIIYIHVPCALMSMAVYSLMTFCAVLSIVWRIKLSDIVLQVSLPLGALFTALALITGSLWGKPMWGTWWIWDARLTSELILLFLYFGLMALGAALHDHSLRGRALAIVTLIGFVDIPLIHYSVTWWATLHQGATITQFAKPSMDNRMLFPLLSMILGFIAYTGSQILALARAELIKREFRAEWVRALLC